LALRRHHVRTQGIADASHADHAFLRTRCLRVQLHLRSEMAQADVIRHSKRTPVAAGRGRVVRQVELRQLDHQGRTDHDLTHGNSRFSSSPRERRVVRPRPPTATGRPRASGVVRPQTGVAARRTGLRAQAGVVRFPTRRPSTVCRLPRESGGGPWMPLLVGTPAQSSPRERGWSDVELRGVNAEQVFPRERGGPLSPVPSPSINWYSPRERGRPCGCTAA
jgi:hypothetical protein